MPRTHYPSYDPALRIAVLTPDLPAGKIQRLMRKCRVIAATPPQLRALAEAVESGRLTLPPVDAGVVVFTGIWHGELTALERDLFWRVFQVPVFEQFLSPDGRILAMECDAHDGLHLLDPDVPLSGYRGFVNTAVCGCGNAQPRLSSFQRLRPQSTPAPGIRPPMPAYVYNYGDQENQQVRPAGRVA